MKKVKLVSDFDGIWTNQEHEAEFVYKWYIKKLSTILSKPESYIESLFEKAKVEMNKAPYKYGWKYNGGISSFFGEDPYGDNNAVFDYFDIICENNSGNSFTKEISQLRDSVLNAGYESLYKFGNELFHESTTEFKEKGFLNPCSNAKAVLEKLIIQKVEVVVASNSNTNKIEYLFSKMGYAPSNSNSPERKNFHARGNSMKFAIEPTYTELPDKLDINEIYKADLRRPCYHKVLIEEKPDFVIGDVFSLDIALPLFLRLNNKDFSKLRVIQKIQKHTPGWVKDYLSKDELKGIAFMIDDIDKLPSLIAD